MSSPPLAADRPARRALALAGWLISVSGHGLVLLALIGQPPMPKPEPAPSAVRFEVVSPPPPPPPPTAEPPEPEPAKPEARLPAKPNPTATPEPEKPIDPPAASEPTGATLASENGRFEMQAGNGEPITGPIAPPSRAAVPTPQPKPAPPVAASPPPVPKTVPLADLSRRPKPPSLDAALERNYPAEARRRGIGGRAIVRARIEADGRVRSARVVSETDPGFGEACRRTVLGTSWSAPVDRDGQPVPTEVSYLCRFRVND